jgi:hypothetical protein
MGKGIKLKPISIVISYYEIRIAAHKYLKKPIYK